MKDSRFENEIFLSANKVFKEKFWQYEIFDSSVNYFFGHAKF